MDAVTGGGEFVALCDFDDCDFEATTGDGEFGVFCGSGSDEFFVGFACDRNLDFGRGSPNSSEANGDS